ncbi:MAG: hypothetical protein MJB12_01710, partial [Firmicutes bacterium]|nr:hypothetical protein [Bacillota bacterium]
MKKSMMIVLLVTIVASAMVSVGQAESRSSLLSEIYQEVRTVYLSDPEYHRVVSENGEAYGEEMLWGIATKRYNRLMHYDTKGQQYSWYYCPTIPLIQQYNDYYCGPAATLSSLYSLGLADDIVITGSYSGSLDDQRQQQLAYNMGTTSDGTSSPAIRDELNSYFSGNPYEWKRVTSSVDADEVKEDFKWSLKYDYPVVIAVSTKHLSYYDG